MHTHTHTLPPPHTIPSHSKMSLLSEVWVVSYALSQVGFSQSWFELRIGVQVAYLEGGPGKHQQGSGGSEIRKERQPVQCVLISRFHCGQLRPLCAGALLETGQNMLPSCPTGEAGKELGCLFTSFWVTLGGFSWKPYSLHLQLKSLQVKRVSVPRGRLLKCVW